MKNLKYIYCFVITLNLSSCESFQSSLAGYSTPDNSASGYKPYAQTKIVRSTTPSQPLAWTAPTGNALDRDIPSNNPNLTLTKNRTTVREYKNKITGVTTTYDPRYQVLVYNPAKGYEELARKESKWVCNAYGNEHNHPDECSHPEKGGKWVTKGRYFKSFQSTNQ